MEALKDNEIPAWKWELIKKMQKRVGKLLPETEKEKNMNMAEQHMVKIRNAREAWRKAALAEINSQESQTLAATLLQDACDASIEAGESRA